MRTSSSSTSMMFSYCQIPLDTTPIPSPRGWTYCSADRGTVAVAGVVVARVELVADQGGTVAADILDLGQLGVGNNTTSRVSGVGGDNHSSTTGDLLGDLVGVDMVTILLRERDGDSGKLQEYTSVLGY